MAGLIPSSFINDLLNQCDIVNLIEQFLPLRKKSGNYEALCPFHQEQSPSFKVSQSKQIYHCFGCGVGGNALSFIMAHQHLSFTAAVEWLADHLHVPMPSSAVKTKTSTAASTSLTQVLSDAVQFYQKELAHTPEALNYLKHRGLSSEVVEHFQIGLAPSAWNNLCQFLTTHKNYRPTHLQSAGVMIQKAPGQQYDRFRERIIFPIRNSKGHYIGLGGRVFRGEKQPKYINSPETTIFKKSQTLYGLYEITHQHSKLDKIWVVEGYLDVVALHQLGIPAAVATLGTAMSRFHWQQLFRFTNTVIICFDGDNAGQVAANRTLEVVLPHLQDTWTIRFLRLPPQADPDSWIRENGPEAWHQLSNQAITLDEFLWQSFQKDLDIHTLDGQRKLLHRALPLIKRIPRGIRQQQLFQRLSHLSNIAVERLEQIHSGQSTHVKQASTTAYTAFERSVGLLLQYPELLIPLLKQSITPALSHHYPLFQQLIEVADALPLVNTATLLELFRHRLKLWDYLNPLAYNNWLIPKEGVTIEFQDIIIYLNKKIRRQTIKDLIQKIRQGTITSAEKQELTQLLKKEAIK